MFSFRKSLNLSLRSKKIILGSASPRRKDILEELGIGFKILVSDYDESVEMQKLNKLPLISRVIGQRFFINKIMKKMVMGKYNGLKEQTGVDGVLCFDTVCFDEHGILGKPQSKVKAFEMLARLNNKTHYVVTACLFVSDSCIINKQCYSTVTFKNNSDDVLERYLQTENTLDAAGSYKIQGSGRELISCYSGSYSNIVGLPKKFIYYLGL